MKQVVLAGLALIGALFAARPEARAQVITPSGPIPLFNGSSFAGLYPWFSTSGFSDPTQVFHITNGLLHVTGDGWGALTTSNRYRDYVMVLEFKWGPRTWTAREGLAKDAGVLFHSRGVEGGWNGLLMPGIQAQMIDGGNGDIILLPGVDAVGTALPMSITAPVEQLPSGINPPNWNYRDGYRWKATGAPATFSDGLFTVHWSGWDPAWEDVPGYRGQTVVESPDGEWNQLLVRATNDTFEILLNGTLINAASNVVPSEGKLQLEVEFAEYFVRRWELIPAGQPVGPIITVDRLPGSLSHRAYSQPVRAAGLAPLTWSIGTGSLPPGFALDPDTGLLTGFTTNIGTFNFSAVVSDAVGLQVTQTFQIAITPANGALVTNGLVLHLDSTQGVTAVGSTVSNWADLSGRGNSMEAVGNPQWGTVQTPLGQPAIRLDGDDDLLRRTAPLMGFPLDNTDRMIFLVARYNNSTWWGGAAYGAAAANQAFGLQVKHPTGELVLHGYGGGNDLVSTTPGIGAGWLVQGGRVSAGIVELFKDGVPVAQFAHNYDTSPGQFIIGGEIGGAGHVGMDVAAILVYDRALDAGELVSMEAYLQSRYLMDPGVPVITVPANISVETTNTGGAIVNFTTTAVDRFGAALATTNTPASGSLFPIGTSTVTSTAVDAAGNSALRTFTVNVVFIPPPVTPQVVIPLINGNLADLLYTWSEAQGNGAVTDRYQVQSGILHVIGNEESPIISHDRYRDYVLVLEYKWGPRQWDVVGQAKNSGILIHSRGYEGGHENRNMPGLEIQMAEGSVGDFLLEMGTDQYGQMLPMSMAGMVGQVACIQDTWNCRGGYRWLTNGVPLNLDIQYGTIHWYGWDPGWQDVTGFRGSINHESPDGQWNQIVVRVQGAQVGTYLNGTKVNELLDSSPTLGKVQLEIEGSEYFVRRFELWPMDSQIGPSIRNDTLPAGHVGQPYQQAVSACAGTGALGWTISAGLLPPGLELNGTNGLITGTPTASGTFSFTARVTDAAGKQANQSLQLAIAPATGMLLTNGLVLHLDSTQGVTGSGNTISNWADLSGKSNSVGAVGTPGWGTVLTPLGLPAVQLDGVDDMLERTSTLNGFPGGNADRTMLVVARYNNAALQAGTAYGTAANNRAFGLRVNPLSGELVLHGSGLGNNLNSTTPGVGAGWMIHAGLVAGGTASHYKNATNIGQFAHTYDTGLDRLVIGSEIGGAGHLSMDVAAVLLYDRALSLSELTNVTFALDCAYLHDAVPPVITLLGSDPLVLAVGEPFSDPGATAMDLVDGDVTPLIVAGGQAVNTSTPGTYTRTYTVTDAVGNTSQRQRPVLVVEVVAPPLQPLCLQDPAESLRINFPTVLGLNYTLFSSTNLVDWAPMDSIPGDGFMTGRTYPGGCTLPMRFFKARVIKAGP